MSGFSKQYEKAKGMKKVELLVTAQMNKQAVGSTYCDQIVERQRRHAIIR